MKKLLLFLTVLFLVSCGPSDPVYYKPLDTGQQIKSVPVYSLEEWLYSANNDNMEVIVIDSCEYYYILSYSGHGYVVPKMMTETTLRKIIREEVETVLKNNDYNYGKY